MMRAHHHAAQPRPITRLTDGEANDQLLYFTSPSLTADDQTLVFLSDRDSPVEKAHDPRVNVNLYALERRSGKVRRLTDHGEGYMRSYVYFEGQPHRGLGLASPSLHAASGDLYYLQGDTLHCVNVHSGKARALRRLPEDQVTGFTHVSDDNTRVCVPTIDERAFQDLRAIDETVQRLGLVGHIRVFDTQSGQQLQDIEVARGWVTHVQFQPGNREVILFNHEWPADCGIRRMWLWDGKAMCRLRPEGMNANGTARSRHDWICHEVWSRDGQSILYHGRYAPGSAKENLNFIARVSPAGRDHIEMTFPSAFRRYGHFTPSNSATRLVSDGYAAFGGAPGKGSGGAWISVLKVDWDKGALEWTPLCPHGSSWASQDAHPHPVFNHAGTEVLFTSDGEGKRAIYSCAP